MLFDEMSSHYYVSILRNNTLALAMFTSVLKANETIQSAFQELRKALNEQEKALLAQSSEIAASKLTSLQLQMEKMASLRDQITFCGAAISEAQKTKKYRYPFAICCHGAPDTINCKS